MPWLETAARDRVRCVQSAQAIHLTTGGGLASEWKAKGLIIRGLRHRLKVRCRGGTTDDVSVDQRVLEYPAGPPQDLTKRTGAKALEISYGIV